MTMKRISRMAGGLGTCALLLCVATGAVEAQEKKALSAAGKMRDALGRVGTGQKIEVVLKNGKAYAGVLGEIGENLVVVQQLSGKEFFDAVIKVKDISSIEVRVR